MPLSQIAQEFPLDPSIIYLNHAAVAPWPQRTVDAVQRFAAENGRVGATHYDQWLARETQLRRQLQALLNARYLDEIGLLKNTSEALSTVAFGLDWQAGDNVVITDQEFPSNRIVWEALQGRFGIQVKTAKITGSSDPEAALLACCDPMTRLMAVSSVQYATGLRLDLSRLGNWCRSHEILFCLDAIQSVGALPTDVQACAADFLMADGHKWMLGPEGLAVFYCRQELMDRLRLNQYGWHMVQRHGDYNRLDWQVANSARRFECGSPNMIGVHALSASLELLLEVGMDTVARELTTRSDFLIQGLSRFEQVSLVTPEDPQQRAGIVTFRLNSGDPAALFQQLRQAGVICAPRGGGIRFSPHFYTPLPQLEEALNLLRRFGLR